MVGRKGGSGERMKAPTIPLAQNDFFYYYETVALFFVCEMSHRPFLSGGLHIYCSLSLLLKKAYTRAEGWSISFEIWSRNLRQCNDFLCFVCTEASLSPAVRIWNTVMQEYYNALFFWKGQITTKIVATSSYIHIYYLCNAKYLPTPFMQYP